MNIPENTKVIKTPTGKAWLDEDGILRAVTDTGAEETLDDVKGNVAAFVKLSGGIRRPTLVDIRGAKSITREGRQYYRGEELTKVQSVLALLVGSPVSRILGNFFLGLNKMPHPARLFTSEAEAIKWLKGFVK